MAIKRLVTRRVAKDKAIDFLQSKISRIKTTGGITAELVTELKRVNKNA